MSDWNDLQHRLDNAREIVQKEKGILVTWAKTHKSQAIAAGLFLAIIVYELFR